jgi:hypothetical protein
VVLVSFVAKTLGNILRCGDRADAAAGFSMLDLKKMRSYLSSTRHPASSIQHLTQWVIDDHCRNAVICISPLRRIKRERIINAHRKIY